MPFENEVAFYEFMEVNGPKAPASKRNYISWLRYVDQKVRDIDKIKLETDIDKIYQILIDTRKTREFYKTTRDASNIRSALRKYCKFTKYGRK